MAGDTRNNLKGLAKIFGLRSTKRCLLGFEDGGLGLWRRAMSYETWMIIFFPSLALDRARSM